MKRGVLAVAAVVVWMSAVRCVCAEESWHDIGRGLTGLTAVAVREGKNGMMEFVGSDKGILKRDSGAEWSAVVSVPSAQCRVHSIVIDPQRDTHIYAATNAGLYCSTNGGKEWKLLFQGVNPSEKNCLSVAVVPYGIYAGTEGGLFVSRDGGHTFRKVSGVSMRGVRCIAYNPSAPEVLFVSALEGVYRSLDSGLSWDRVVVGHPRVDEDATVAGESDDDHEESLPDIHAVVCDRQDPMTVYAAALRTISVSHDRGRSWESVDGGGPGGRIETLFVSRASVLYAVCTLGIFEFGGGRWKELSVGLEGNRAVALTQDSQGMLYAAGDKGLFVLNGEGESTGSSSGHADAGSKQFPSITEVQDAAVKYADVEAGKIKRWRSQAAAKAWLPKLSTGINRDTGDLWHWEGGSTTKEEDDILRKGRSSLDWDISLTWDFGELIWSLDQTSIDVRSRLMVEQRNSILTEVTKLYFERQRLIGELGNLPIADKKLKNEKELKLQEITAMLDAFTGGFCTRSSK